jgi:orotate phosphoribosyltransferase
MDYSTSAFVKFMYNSGVLTFGDFTLKSGRRAPYFINTGKYCTGEQIAALGRFYAECFVKNNIEADTLFGPAYKGIPLAVAAASALSESFGKNVNYCFDRKEAKDHGEGGVIVGKKLTDGERVCIIEDVITAGTAIRETLPVLKSAADVNITGMIISVDRNEKTASGRSAVNEVYEEFGIKITPIVTINDIIKAIEDRDIGGYEYLPAINDYRKAYGADI